MRRIWYERLRDGLKRFLVQRVRGRLLPLKTWSPRAIFPPADTPTAAATVSSRSELVAWLSEPRNELMLPSTASPSVSIIIPTFNRADCLLRCLRSIVCNTSGSFEVIVVDDASTDETSELLSRVRCITRIGQRVRADFITSCNRGAARARGKYLLFLNSDTEVPSGWLSQLVSTLEADRRHGAVGARLVHLDGTLQEAGSMVWRDGSTAAYGRGADPGDPEYSYRREVDYCSAACLLVRADLFAALKGFDERYKPAYYEDADLCLRMRRLGYKVLLDPHVTVLHHESASRPRSEAVALMRRNRLAFAAAFPGALATQFQPTEVLRARDRRPGMRVLVLDDQVPAPYLGSGFPRARKLLQMLSDLGCVISFAATTAAVSCAATTRELQALGIEVIPGTAMEPERLLRARERFYDSVIVSRPHNGARLLDLVRETQPQATIVYDAEALYFERALQQAALGGVSLSERQRHDAGKRELGLVSKAHRIIVVSNQDRATIVRETGHPHVSVWGYPQESRERLPGLEERRDLLFVGGFCGGHPPNTDAAMRLANELLPRIRQRLPACRLFIVGSTPPPAVCQLNSLRTIVTGYVDDIAPYYDHCRVFAAPFRFGSGISCKVVDAMRNGIPAVVSPLIANALELRHECEVLISADDDQFADNVIRLYRDEDLWLRLQHNADAWIRHHCATPVMLQTLGKIVNVAVTDPGVAI